MKKIIIIVLLLFSCSNDSLSVKKYYNEINTLKNKMQNEFKNIKKDENHDKYIEIFTKYSNEIINLKVTSKISEIEKKYDVTYKIYLDEVVKLTYSDASVENKILSKEQRDESLKLIQKSLEEIKKIEENLKLLAK